MREDWGGRGAAWQPGSKSPAGPTLREGEGLRWLLPRAGSVSRVPALPHCSVSWTSPLLAKS